MFVPSRSRRQGPDPRLDIKIGLFSVGAILALVGMLTDNRWVLVAATIILLAGFLLQFRGRRTRADGPDGDDVRAEEDEDGSPGAGP